MTVLAAKRLITASEFTQMCEIGVFREDDRLELIGRLNTERIRG